MAEDMDGLLRSALSSESPDLIADNICQVKSVELQVFKSSSFDEC